MHVQHLQASRKELLSTGSENLYPPIWKLLFLACVFCSSGLLTVGSLFMLLVEKKRNNLKRVNIRSNLLENREVLWRVVEFFWLTQLISKETGANYFLEHNLCMELDFVKAALLHKIRCFCHLPFNPAWWWLGMDRSHQQVRLIFRGSVHKQGLLLRVRMSFTATICTQEVAEMSLACLSDSQELQVQAF